MGSSSRHTGVRRTSLHQLLIPILAIGFLLQSATAEHVPIHSRVWQAQFMRHSKRSVPTKRGPPDDGEGKVPLVITNHCETKLWPGLASQAGTGPGTGGFELESGESKRLWVGATWQGRVWGRTNCTVNKDSCACKTGDCMGQLDCKFSGQTPATLAEFNLAGGERGDQTFYDISLVDGYNIPIGINHIPSKNTTQFPPNLTNCACIATAGWLYDTTTTEKGTYYSNSTYPVPLESTQTNKDLENWCPWPDLAFPPIKPGDGVYPYPDDNIQRPDFSPCNSACATTGSKKDCCVGKYHDPKICKPSDYSRAAKAICPDAYSFAFDDQQSTFITPKGGGWEVVMCPKGRSTKILKTLGPELFELADTGKLSDDSLKRLSNATYIDGAGSAANDVGPVLATMMVSLLITTVWLSS